MVRSLFEYKFVSLFSMLFGIGLIVQMQRAEKRNRPFVGLYLRRTFILMALGLAHAFLLWYGDILFIYSLVAFLALWCRRLSPRVTLALCAGALAMSVLLSAGFTLMGVVFGQRVTEATQAQTSEPIQSTESSDVDVENRRSILLMQSSSDARRAFSRMRKPDRNSRFGPTPAQAGPRPVFRVSTAPELKQNGTEYCQSPQLLTGSQESASRS